MKKIGLIILFLSFPLNYILKYNLGFDAVDADYRSTFMLCTGIALISYSLGKECNNRKEKYLFYYAISIFNILLISTYAIDLLIDPIFQTAKVIWSIIISTFITLCVYFFSQKY